MVFANFLNLPNPTLYPKNSIYVQNIKNRPVKTSNVAQFSTSNPAYMRNTNNYQFIEREVKKLYPVISNSDMVRISVILDPVFTRYGGLTKQDIDEAIKRNHAQKSMELLPNYVVARDIAERYNKLSPAEKDAILKNPNPAKLLGIDEDIVSTDSIRKMISSLNLLPVDYKVPLDLDKVEETTLLSPPEMMQSVPELPSETIVVNPESATPNEELKIELNPEKVESEKEPSASAFSETDENDVKIKVNGITFDKKIYTKLTKELQDKLRLPEPKNRKNNRSKLIREELEEYFPDEFGKYNLVEDFKLAKLSAYIRDKYPKGIKIGNKRVDINDFLNLLPNLYSFDMLSSILLGIEIPIEQLWNFLVKSKSKVEAEEEEGGAPASPVLMKPQITTPLSTKLEGNGKSKKNKSEKMLMKKCVIYH